MALFLWLAFFWSAHTTATPDLRQLMHRVEVRYQSAHTFECVFLERYIENGKAVRAESGKAYFRKPGKMRWEYESPEAKLFLIDGKSVWFYVPADRTALRSRVKESSDWRTPFSLLVRSPRFADLCKSVTLGLATEAASPGNALLHCRPKGATSDGREEILLEIAPDTGDLKRAVIHESGAVQIEFFFAKWTRNPTLPAQQFEFHPPLGVAIVEAEPPR